MPELAQSSHAVRGYCALCTAHCATIATVSDGKVVRLDPDYDHPNGGVICIKGKGAAELVYHPDRLNYPLKRTRPKNDPDPGWQRVSWDEALDDIARRMNAIRKAMARYRTPRARRAALRSPIRNGGCPVFSIFSAVQTGYPRPMSATGTKTPGLLTRLALRFRPRRRAQ